jgi:nitroimidazol reductase NimA-like FMN-containing flavoprotein (pyridoxamine 5'-phosphate oxidase superfamily)
MEHIEYAQTRGLSESEVEERLEATHTGVLALASEAESYAIPLAHFYDGQNLYLRLGMSPGSTKATFLESTKKATYLLYGAEPTEAAHGLDSWSIVLTGALEEIPPAEYERFDTAEINARFAPIRVFGEDIDQIEIKIYEFLIESSTGRATLDLE